VSTLPSGVRRLGSRLVNFFLLEDDGRATLVDAGAPGYRSQLDAETTARIDAVVLTHAHADHVGVAELLRTERGIPVHVHEADAELARSAKPSGKNEGSLLPYLRHPTAWQLLFELSRRGAMKPRPVHEVRTFSDGKELDVPGRLRVVHTPGHTAGHCALLSEATGSLFAGDALCTLNPLTGERGAQLMPKALTADVQRALDSLDRLADPRARVLLPGHGEPVADPAAAVEAAKRRGPT
jgi:glyoxylase-like metal-dependent hydrolase (beta-lactamase superfamily II)